MMSVSSCDSSSNTNKRISNQWLIEHFFPLSNCTEIISDDSPKSSIKKQSENGENNGTTAKPSEPMAAAVSVCIHYS